MISDDSFTRSAFKVPILPTHQTAFSLCAVVKNRTFAGSFNQVCCCCCCFFCILFSLLLS